MQDTYTANATTKINLTYEQTVDLLISFLEKEYDSYSKGLDQNCVNYAEGKTEFALADIKDNIKILDAIEHVISYYKEY